MGGVGGLVVEGKWRQLYLKNNKKNKNKILNSHIRKKNIKRNYNTQERG